MKAAFLIKPQKIDFQEIEIPEPAWGEVRVKLQKVGICGSDVHLFLGHRLLEKPTIIGHEGIGIIEKLGPGVENRQLGERVAVEPNVPCQKCKFCQQGRGNICVNKRVKGLNENGCFAEYIVLPEAFAWKIPDEISDEDAVVLEPTAVAVHALFNSKTKPGDTIAIIGLGAIGLLINHLAFSVGYEVLVTEPKQEKLNLATKEGAIAIMTDGNTENQIAQLSEAWESNEVSAVFECAGVSQTASLATSAAPRGSEIILVGLSAGLSTFTPLKIAREGIHIVPSIIYDHPTDFRRAIQLIKSKIITPSKIISSISSFENLQSALELAAEGNESKIVVTFD
ncbi:zinc-dependent alcohol dehydrogenase [Lacihabitans soyangensis]|uniref:L-iditol 2-dehydrogenase n=1 Tax=Lacihabitans soyangensis TaxID=869394 RepID=A0AAE3H4S7_9BACT|nr:alcohol dehydrogenase catalytic domain-containing protein [Lacihabitans soyangensis]MCP9763966.1 L-iditol 2-dehydrogenase [Lacihabitans soyangensis]